MGDLDPSILYPLKSLGGLFCLCLLDDCFEQVERILIGPEETLSPPPPPLGERKESMLSFTVKTGRKGKASTSFKIDSGITESSPLIPEFF